MFITCLLINLSICLFTPIHKDSMFNPSVCVEEDCKLSLSYQDSGNNKKQVDLRFEVDRIRPEYSNTRIVACAWSHSYFVDNVFKNAPAVNCSVAPSIWLGLPIPRE